MRKLDVNKLASLQTANAMLDEKYGIEGCSQRQSFDAESKAWYSSQIEKSSYHITMPVELHETISQRAQQMGQTISDYISQVLAQTIQMA